MITIYCNKGYVNVASLSKYLIVPYSPLHSKEALHGFSLACLKCQHHCLCTLGPTKSDLNSSIRVLWQSTWYPEHLPSDSQVGAAQRGCAGQKGWFEFQAGQSGMAWDFIILLRKVPQFKTYELLLSGIFHLIFPDFSWPWITEVVERETTERVGLLYYDFFSHSPLEGHLVVSAFGCYT